MIKLKDLLGEDFHYCHDEYRLYEGNDSIVVAFDDGTRLKFEVHFRNSHGIDREKWRKKAMSTWKSCANELYRDVPLSDACNPIRKSWKKCFKEALSDLRMKPYVQLNPHQKIFDDKNTSPVIDPINFTRYG